MKRVLILLLAVLMTLSFVGCRQAGEEEATLVSEVELSAGGKYPAETVKIGFVNYDTTAEQVLKIREYFEYLQQYLNFEIIWSESLKNAEQEFAFIERCAAAGCHAILGYYNEGREESVKYAARLDMYYWGLNGLDDAYEVMKMDRHYLGGYDVEGIDYEMGKACAQILVESGCRKIIVVSGGKEYGIQIFINRYNGIIDGFEEAMANGYDIEVVYEVPGWPGTEEFTAHQIASLEKDADGIASTLTMLHWVQPLQTAGMIGKIKIAAMDTASETIADMMDEGLYVGIVSEVAGSFGLAIPKIINAVEGYDNQQRNEDGSASMIKTGRWVLDNVADVRYIAALEQAGGEWTFDIEDVRSVLGAYSPGFTVEDMNVLYSAVSVAEIQARKDK